MEEQKFRPDKQCVAYKRNAPRWQRLADLFMGPSAWLDYKANGTIGLTSKTSSYLPKEPAETDVDYLNRVVRSPFHDRFALSVRKFVNLIFANGIDSSKVNPQLALHLENLDYEGGTFQQFLNEHAVKVMTFGHSFLYVDAPATDIIPQNLAEYRQSGLRPYWAQYSPLQVPWFKPALVGGRRVLVEVALKEVELIDTPKGEVEVEQWRWLRPGSYEVWQRLPQELRQDSNVPEFRMVSSGQTSLGFIPLVPTYADLREGWFFSRPPLGAMSDLNLTHYQVFSDHLRKLHLCCMPVPVLRDSQLDPDKSLVIGPNSFLHIRDPGGMFTWAEPLATSIEQSRREVQDLESRMDILSAAYLATPADRQAAKTTEVQVVELESTLEGFCSSFGDGVNDALRVHGAYLGITDPGTVSLSGDILKEDPRDFQLLDTLGKLDYQNQLSRETFLTLLKNAGFLPEDFDLSSELARPAEMSPDLVDSLVKLVQWDLLGKRRIYAILQRLGYIPNEWSIDDLISETGETLRVESVFGAAQPALDDAPTANPNVLAATV